MPVGNKNKERPIIFNSEMVKSILDGRKIMTRRIIKKAWDGFSWAGNVYPARESGWIAWWPKGDAEFTKKVYIDGFLCPFGQIGTNLWVRETWRLDFCGAFSKSGMTDATYSLNYKANNHETILDYQGKIEEDPYSKIADRGPDGWRPSIFMPRRLSRLILEITDVKVERLQEISEEDVKREGFEWGAIADDPFYRFAKLWDSIYGPGSWEVNPWLWVIEFRLMENFKAQVRKG